MSTFPRGTTCDQTSTFSSATNTRLNSTVLALKLLEPIRILMELSYSNPTNQSQRAAENVLVYRNLPGRRDIRLIKLPQTTQEPFELLTTSVDDAPGYSALSYTWGSPLRGVREAEYEGTPISQAITTPAGTRWICIGRNLHEAICAIIKTNSASYLWADGICIDQTNPDEKLVQIPLMGEIYSRCEKAIVWLGEDMEGIDDMVHIHHHTLGPELAKHPWSEFTKQVHLHPRVNSRPPSTDQFVSANLKVSIGDKCWKSYVAFYDLRRWFSRLWVVQEIALAPQVQVLCGTECLDWDRMCDVASAILLSPSISTQLQLLRITKTQRSIGSEIFTPGSFRARCRSGNPLGDENRPSGRVQLFDRTGARTDREVQYAFLESCLRIVWGYKVKFAEDKIYAILGLYSRFFPGDLDPLLFGDNAASLTVQQLYQNVTWLLLREIPLLASLSSVEDASLRRTPRLPSWVPDYNAHRADNTLPSLVGHITEINASKHYPGKHCFRSVSGRELMLEGIAFDSITSAAESWNAVGIHSEQHRLQVALTVLGSHLRLCHDGHQSAPGSSVYKTLHQTVMAGSVTPDQGPLLHDFILSTLAYANLKGESDHPGFQQCLLSLQALEEAAASGFPTMTELEQAMASCASEAHRDTEDFRRREGRYYDFSARAAWIGLNRRLFRTKRGLLGLGPRSLEPGDQVWLIDGAKYLFVLRKTAEDGRFTLVGEAYVHGFMNGEVFASDVGDKMQRFVLV